MSSRDEIDLDALIEDARNRGDALRTLFPNDGDIRDDARLYETLADSLESTLAELRQERERAKVFEQAHTPTDDEREALVKAITDTRVDAPSLYAGADGKWPLWDTGDEEPELIAESVLAAGFRRTVQGETEG